MIHIVGDGVVKEAQVFYDVRNALNFKQDIHLLAQLAMPYYELKNVYNLEPLYDGCRSFSIGYLETLKRCMVLDYSALNVEYLRGHGIEAFHMPYGYSKGLERVKPANKDIDVLCVGSVNPRRQVLFSRMPKHINFVWAQNVYGDALDKLVARAKVHVNVHYRDDHQLEVVRLNYLMANGCTVVSERGNEPHVNTAYAPGLIFADYNSIIDACIFALGTPVDGIDCIRNLPQDCGSAQYWLDSYQGT